MRMTQWRFRVLSRVFDVANRLVRPLLRSPLHRILSGRLMLLTYEGVKSGRTYAIPVAYYRWEPDEVWAFSARTGWASNFRAPRAVQVLLRGREVRAVGTVVEEPEQLAELIEELVRRKGPGAVRDPFLGLPRDRLPTHDEALAAADKARIVRFRQTGAADGTAEGDGSQASR